MAKRPSVLTGTAGVYYVAYQLAARGFHAAVTYGNAPRVDLLVSSVDGAATISVQVKAATRALRTRGRKDNKEPHHYEWDVGERSAATHNPELFFAFVDLKQGSGELPDVFIVSSEHIFGRFRRALQSSGVSRYRWHPRLSEADPFKNDWDRLLSALQNKASKETADLRTEGAQP